MPSPLQTAGASLDKPTKYAALHTNEFWTGLWTNRNPMRDAATPYLYQKFYSAARYESMIGGQNVELSSRLTPVRRPGNPVYNSQSFPAINDFYAFRTFNPITFVETIRVMADTASVVYDATGPSTQTTVFTKSSGAGQTSFQSIGNTLYMADGVDAEKWLQPGPWVAQTSIATTQYQIGTTVIDSNGSLQYLVSMQVGNITSVQISGKLAILIFNNTNFGLSLGMSFSPSGLTGGSFLNLKRLYTLSVIPSGSTYIVTAFFDHPNYGATADSGTATTTDVGTSATTGATAPTWSVVNHTFTTDGLSQWQNFTNPVYSWGAPATPKQAPIIGPQPFGSPFGTTGIWQASTLINQNTSILDQNGNIQTSLVAAVTGSKYPNFIQPAVVGGSYGLRQASDGAQSWIMSIWFGSPATGPALTGPTGWVAATAVISTNSVGGDVLVDTNGNLQMAISGSGSSGSSAPTWNTTYGGSTTDSGITWRNIGPYLALAFSTGFEWGYAYHCIDGSVSTMSPLTLPSYPVLAGVPLTGIYSSSQQVDSVWIFRTTQGQVAPFFLASIPNVNVGTTWTFIEQNPDSNLNNFIAGPQAGVNNPPPTGLTGLAYYLSRMWGIVGEFVYYSGAPQESIGVNVNNWNPNNYFQFPSTVTKLWPSVTGMLFFTNQGIYLSSGTDGNGNPNQPVPLLQDIGLLSRNCFAVNGSIPLLFTADRQFVSLDPSAGVSRIGFPIEDLLGAFDPTLAYVTWHTKGGDQAAYICDGATGWYRINLTPAPETGGYTWSPFAAIAVSFGIKCIKSIETSPGSKDLLIGPARAGQILRRDPTTWEDAGNTFVASFTIGSITLSQPGQAAEVAFITTEAMAVGNRPSVSILCDEIATVAGFAQFELLTDRENDPPWATASESVYSDRWYLMQGNPQPTWMRHCQIQFQWPAENFQNELLTYTFYAALKPED